MRKCLPELADDLCLLPRSLSSVAGDFAVLNLATLFFKFSGNSEAGLGRLAGTVMKYERDLDIKIQPVNVSTANDKILTNLTSVCDGLSGKAKPEYKFHGRNQTFPIAKLHKITHNIAIKIIDWLG